MTVKEGAEKDYKKLKRITKGVKGQEEILEIADYWMGHAVSLDDTARWYDEAVRKIAPDKAEEVERYVFAEMKAKFLRENPWLREVEIGRATEE